MEIDTTAWVMFILGMGIGFSIACFMAAQLIKLL